jgi:hypothetical protein
MKSKYSLALFLSLFCFLIANSQTDYTNLNNWAFHPNKTGTFIDGFNLNIAVVDENLTTTSIILNTNNAMNNTGVDVFFIHPTVLQNMGSYTTIENIPIANQNANFVQASIRGQAGLLAKYGRMFAPRYRQATPPTFISSPLDANQAAILNVAYDDVKAAFLNYLTNYNNGNKIILASHSQGAFLAGFLLRDVFDLNPSLRDKLVVAVVAGMPSNYSTNNSLTGGWWQNIPFCSQINECGCVMNWRTFKEGYALPTPQGAHPAFNPFVVTSGLVYSQFNLSQNTITQDNLYYTNQTQPLRNFITLRSNVTFGGNVGYVAFDSLYNIRYLQSSNTQVGFVVEHNPKPNEQRPNLLLDEETTPGFSGSYHQKDYNIYTWALLEQIDLKLNTCGNTLSIANITFSNDYITVYPNPTSDLIFLKNNQGLIKNEKVEIIDFTGKIVISIYSNSEGAISVLDLSNGLYFVKTKFSATKLIINKNQ